MTYEVADLNTAKLPKETYDVVYVHAALHHVFQLEHLLDQIKQTLKPGVIVHVHDIFLPFDYRRDWVMDEFRFRTEQYLLQAFLTFNSEFEVLMANSYRQPLPYQVSQSCLSKLALLRGRQLVDASKDAHWTDSIRPRLQPLTAFSRRLVQPPRARRRVRRAVHAQLPSPGWDSVGDERGTGL